MATATKATPGQRVELLAQPKQAPPAALATEAPTEPKPYWGDWAAMVFWTLCLGLMAVIHLKDLVVAIFR